MMEEEPVSVSMALERFFDHCVKAGYLSRSDGDSWFFYLLHRIQSIEKLDLRNFKAFKTALFTVREIIDRFDEINVEVMRNSEAWNDLEYRELMFDAIDSVLRAFHHRIVG